MPIYEYLCGKCAQVSEVLQKFSDPPLSKCPLCGGKVKKLMSHNSFQLKGSGWYATDYGRPASGGKTEKDAAQPSGEAAAPESSSPAPAPAGAESGAEAAKADTSSG
jgi:putative FmdB family regulatory protein